MSTCRNPRRSVAGGVLAPLAVALAVAAVAAPRNLAAQQAGTGDLKGLNLPPKEQDDPDPVNDPKAIEIVDRYLSAIGGLEVLNAVEDRTHTFETIKHQAGSQTTAKLRLFQKKGYKLREEWDIPGFSIKDRPLRFVQVYNGLDGWVQMFGTVSPLEGRTLSIFVWDKPIADFFCTWKEDGYSLIYVNEGVLNDEPVEILQTTDFTNTNRVRYFFSKSTGLLLKKEWREQGRSGNLKKEDYYLKYIDIPFSDGSGRKLKVPLQHKVFENSNPDTERLYSEVKINGGLKDAIFARPPGIDFKKAKALGGGSVLDSVQKVLGEGAAPSATAGKTPEKPPEGIAPKKKSAALPPKK